MPYYYLTTRGEHVVASQPVPHPERVQCTKEQYDNHKNYRIVDGVIIERDGADLLALARKERHTLIVTQAQSRLAALAGDYPPAEVATWVQQAHEAAAYKHDHRAATPLLTSIAGVDGRDALVRKVSERAAAYNAAVGAIIAARRAAQQAIDGADSVEAVRSVTL